MGLSFACVCVLAVLPQQPAAKGPDSGLVFVGPESAGFRGFALGTGGVEETRGELEVLAEGRCRTPGGVDIQCRIEGTRLVFPSGAQLLFAPDGYLHSRKGAVAGPFPGGAQLWLGDDSVVSFDRVASRRTPIRQVLVTAGDRSVCLWQRRRAKDDEARAQTWEGERLFCLGDGDAVYRSLALPPVVTLERVLGKGDDRSGLPTHRLALDVATLQQSMQDLIRERGDDSATEVRDLRAFAANSDLVFAQAAQPARIGSSPLTFMLRGGFELRFLLDRSSLRMHILRSGNTPFAEWKLGYGSNVRSVAVTRPVGRAVAVPAVASELGVREERYELGTACAVIAAMQKSGR